MSGIFVNEVLEVNKHDSIVTLSLRLNTVCQSCEPVHVVMPIQQLQTLLAMCSKFLGVEVNEKAEVIKTGGCPINQCGPGESLGDPLSIADDTF
jgi:translation initiation factor 2 alpha subunit (eIF-2alpha)